MTATGKPACDEVVLRLVDGERPGDDPGLAEHLGTCLGCFRAAAELRDVPELARTMRQDAAAGRAAADPGEAFWRELATVTGERWQSLRAGGATAAPAPVAAKAPASPSPWARMLGWLRLPAPAAFAAGAALAAVVTVVVIDRARFAPGEWRDPAGPERSEGTRLFRSVPAAAAPRVVTNEAPTPTTTTAAAEDELATPALLGEHDPWDELDVRDLRKVVARLDAETSAGLPLADDEGADLSVSEELDDLEAEDLRQVVRALPGRHGI